MCRSGDPHEAGRQVGDRVGVVFDLGKGHVFDEESERAVINVRKQNG